MIPNYRLNAIKPTSLRTGVACPGSCGLRRLEASCFATHCFILARGLVDLCYDAPLLYTETRPGELFWLHSSNLPSKAGLVGGRLTSSTRKRVSPHRNTLKKQHKVLHSFCILRTITLIASDLLWLLREPTCPVEVV
eukprot:3658900-Amphidinium_carterae.1